MEDIFKKKMLWDVKKADQEFSIFIRKRDGKCMNPKCVCGLNYDGVPIQSLQCSHYYDRGIWLTRYDPDNCIAMGPACHRIWENDKQGRYREFMIRWLGKKKFDDMKQRVDDYLYKNTPVLTISAVVKQCREFITAWKRKN